MPGDAPLNPSEKSVLSRAFANRRFVRVIEVVPPRGHDTRSAIDQALQLRARRVDAVHVPDGATGPRLSALSLAVLIRQQAGIDVVLQFSSRDKPLIVMQSELLGAHALGVRNLLPVTGDVRPVGDYSDATSVTDVDSIGLVNAMSRLNKGLDVGGQTIGSATAFHIGVTVNPAADDLDEEMRRFEWKVEAGAEVRDHETRVRRQSIRADASPARVSGPPGRPERSAVRKRARRRVSGERSARCARAVGDDRTHATRTERRSGRARKASRSQVRSYTRFEAALQGVNVIPPLRRFDLGLALLDALA